MDSIDNFRNSLSEFDILIDYARRNISKVDKYQLFIKLSVVLLSTKLEVFIEDFVEEHSIRMLKGHTNISLPQDIKNNYLNRAVELIANERKQHKYLQPVITQYFVRNKSEICHRPLRVHSKG